MPANHEDYHTGGDYREQDASYSKSLAAAFERFNAKHEEYYGDRCKNERHCNHREPIQNFEYSWRYGAIVVQVIILLGSSLFHMLVLSHIFYLKITIR